MQLYQLATQLELTDVATSVKATLVEELDKWTDPQGCTKRPAFCFVYDPQGKGMVGQTASFGSDEYNDHHFHYGYFLYTAALLATDDPSLRARWQPVMDLIAADIAGAATNGLFPDRRALRRVQLALVGQRSRAVRRREQPGKHLRSGQCLDRPQPLGGRDAQPTAQDPSHVDAREGTVDRAALRPAARHQ